MSEQSKRYPVTHLPRLIAGDKHETHGIQRVLIEAAALYKRLGMTVLSPDDETGHFVQVECAGWESAHVADDEHAIFDDKGRKRLSVFVRHFDWGSHVFAAATPYFELTITHEQPASQNLIATIKDYHGKVVYRTTATETPRRFDGRTTYQDLWWSARNWLWETMDYKIDRSGDVDPFYEANYWLRMDALGREAVENGYIKLPRALRLHNNEYHIIEIYTRLGFEIKGDADENYHYAVLPEGWSETLQDDRVRHYALRSSIRDDKGRLRLSVIETRSSVYARLNPYFALKYEIKGDCTEGSGVVHVERHDGKIITSHFSSAWAGGNDDRCAEGYREDMSSEAEDAVKTWLVAEKGYSCPYWALDEIAYWERMDAESEG